jgi:hypothetical protein
MSILTKEAVDAGFAAAAKLKSGAVPEPEVLAAAPLLDSWLVEPLPGTPFFCLYGYVTGHPSIPDGMCSTSAVLHVADDDSWMRTISRIYRLGPPMSAKLEKTDA